MNSKLEQMRQKHIKPVMERARTIQEVAKPKPELSDEDVIRVHVWLTSKQVSQLDVTAKKTGLTRSFLLRDAISLWLNTRASSMEEFIQQQQKG
jgi:hypothetical protein